MNVDHLTRYTAQRQHDINLVRLHLQVTTRSDMSINDLKACPYHSTGKRRPQQIISDTTWPRQPTVTISQQCLWKNYISSTFIRYGRKWRQPVELQETKLSPTLPTAYYTLADYLKSLPQNQQRLLHDYEQDTTDVEIWNAFRSCQRLTIASDGSLLTKAGTFGWKLTTAKHATLFFGSGPVDGPI